MYLSGLIVFIMKNKLLKGIWIIIYLCSNFINFKRKSKWFVKIINHRFTSFWGCIVTTRLLTLDETDRLVERCPARTGVTHRDVLEPDRHAAVEDELVRG